MAVSVTLCTTTQREPFYTLRGIAGGSSTVLRQGSAEPARTTLVNFAKQAVAWMSGERGHRRTIGDLAALDNRTLADIGLTRDVVEHIARFGRLPKGW